VKQSERGAIDTGIIALLLYCFFAWIAKVIPQKNEEEVRDYDEELSDRIDRLYYINKQIKAVEELITDIDLTGGEHQKNISLDWQTAAGQKYTADMWIDGQSDVTEQMRVLAEKRLEELTTSLLKEIDSLQKTH